MEIYFLDWGKCSDYKGRRKSNYKNVPYDSGESLIDYHMIMVIVMDYHMIMVIVTDHHISNYHHYHMAVRFSPIYI
jgi:hypothetical protein